MRAAQLLELGRHRLPVRRQQLEFRFQQREGAIRAAQEEHEEPQVVEHDLCVEHQAFGRVGSMYRVGSPCERQHRVVAVEEVAHADLIATRDPHFDQRMTGIEPRPQIARDLELPAVIDVWRFLAQARQQLSGAGLVEVDPGEANPELLLHPKSLPNGIAARRGRLSRTTRSRVCGAPAGPPAPQPGWSAGRAANVSTCRLSCRGCPSLSQAAASPTCPDRFDGHAPRSTSSKLAIRSRTPCRRAVAGTGPSPVPRAPRSTA